MWNNLHNSKRLASQTVALSWRKGTECKIKKKHPENLKTESEIINIFTVLDCHKSQPLTRAI